MQTVATKRNAINRCFFPDATARPRFDNHGKGGRTPMLPKAVIDICGKPNLEPEGFMVRFKLNQVEHADFSRNETIAFAMFAGLFF
jgi:hypothetical protein